MSAEPAPEVEQAEATLKGALAEVRIQEAMREHILRLAREQTQHPFVLLTDEVPPAHEEGEISYGSLASEGIDTVLEISVPTLALAGEWDVNPPLALVMAVRTRLVRVADGTPLYESTVEYRGRARTFTDWAVNHAQPFHEELDRAYQSLASKIVEELFLLYYPLWEARHPGG